MLKRKIYRLLEIYNGVKRRCLRIRLNSIKNLHLGRDVLILNKPIISIKDRDSKIIINDNVVLNSDNNNYFTSIDGPVKLQVSNGAKISIGSGTRIHGSSFRSVENITIGKNVLIASGCHIFDTNRHNFSFDNLNERLKIINYGNPVVIEDYAWIGINCIILPGVTIGEGSVIGAGSVVTKDIPPFSKAAGNPCKVYYTHK